MESLQQDFDMPPLFHSRLGIASLAIGLLVIAIWLLILLNLGSIESSTPGVLDPNAPAAALISFLILLGFFLNIFGVGLGIAALLQPHRKRSLAMLGLTLNSIVLLAVVFLFALGVVLS